MAKIIKIETREASLKRRLRRHLKKLGFVKSEDGLLQMAGTGKDVIRSLHSSQRADRLAQSRDFIKAHSADLLKHFATGKDIDPSKIQPVLERVRAGTEESDLFRLASLTWSVPVSNGFGRRIRYLVRDKQNDKIIGLIAIGDPVFNLSVRDKLIGWDSKARGERLVNLMDAYVLGAIAPYNALLGGKLVACMLRTRDVYDDFQKEYGDTTGIISGKEKKARLLAVMTTSSLGRSSIYNRLKLGETQYFKPIGYTSGWGHFHIPDKLFADLRDYLRHIKHPYADKHRFGQGPNWRLRTTRTALEIIGFKEDVMKHGIKREVFLCEFASNALKILKAGEGRPYLRGLLSAEEVAGLALERWVRPRAQRRPEYQSWTADDLKLLLTNNVKIDPPKLVATK